MSDDKTIPPAHKWKTWLDKLDPQKGVQPDLGAYSIARVYKVFRFCASHHLPCMEEGHPCRNVHGHNFKLIVHCAGRFNCTRKKNGMVVEFASIKEVVQPIVDKLDHGDLNNYVKNPTCENVAQWLFFCIREHLPSLDYVVLQETEDCGVQFPAWREYRSSYV